MHSKSAIDWTYHIDTLTFKDLNSLALAIQMVPYNVFICRIMKSRTKLGASGCWKEIFSGSAPSR